MLRVGSRACREFECGVTTENQTIRSSAFPATDPTRCFISHDRSEDKFRTVHATPCSRWHGAAGAQRDQEGSLRLDAATSQRIIDRCKESRQRIIHTSLESDRSLRDLWREHQWIEALGDKVGLIEADECSHRSDDGVDAISAWRRKPLGHIPPKFDKPKVWSDRCQKRLTTRRPGRNRCAGAKSGERSTNENVSGVKALRNGGQHQSIRGD
jgi:hypothetical protein